MKDKLTIEELEKRVEELRKEAYELKRQIQLMKKESIHKEHSHNKLQTDISKQTKNNNNIIKESIDWEKQIGQVWLPRIFIFVFLLGVIWAFKAASDYGLINNQVKISIGYISAFLLLLLGNLQMKRKRSALGQVLLGGSVVLLLIVTFAMHTLYELIHVLPALLLNILWVILGIFLANRFKSQPLAVLTAVGGYLIPFLINYY